MLVSPFDTNMERVVAPHLEPYLLDYCNKVQSNFLNQRNESIPVRLSPARWDMGATSSRRFADIDEELGESTDSQSQSRGDWNSSECFRDRSDSRAQADTEKASVIVIDLEEELEPSPQQFFDTREEQPVSDIDVVGDVDADMDMGEDVEEEYPTEKEIMKALKKKAKWITEDVCHRWRDKKKNTKESRLKTARAKPQQSQDEPERSQSLACTMRGCTFRLPPSKAHTANLARHLHSHYPDAYFCPICDHTFKTRGAFRAHLTRVPKAPRTHWQACKKGKTQGPVRGEMRTGYAKEGVRNSDGLARDIGSGDSDDDEPEACCASPEALWFEVGRDQDRFNIYWLGMMEKWEMPDSHFAMIAGRRRGEIP